MSIYHFFNPIFYFYAGNLDGGSGAVSMQNKETQIELVKKTKKLDKLKEKVMFMALILKKF